MPKSSNMPGSRKIYNDSANPATGRILRAAPGKNTGMRSSMVRESESGKFVTERLGKAARKRNEI